MPDGTSVLIDNLPATDTGGYAGLADDVDLHTWKLLKGVALATLLGVGSELAFGSSDNDLVKALQLSTQSTTNRAGQRLVERNLNVQPTITVRPGWPLRVIVHKDIVSKALPRFPIELKQRKRRTPMPVIGTFSAVKDGYAGTIRTLTVSTKIRVIANDRKEAEGAPDFRIMAGPAEIGVAWRKTKKDFGGDLPARQARRPRAPATDLGRVARGD